MDRGRLIWAALLLLLAVGVGVAFWRAPEARDKALYLVVKSPEERAAAARAEALRIGMRARVMNLDLGPQNRMATLVIGREIEKNRWDFRGQARVSGALKPVYGEATLICDDRLNDAACWRVASLVIDGQLAAAEVDEGSEEERPTTAEAPAVEESADASAEADEPPADATPSPEDAGADAAAGGEDASPDAIAAAAADSEAAAETVEAGDAPETVGEEANAEDAAPETAATHRLNADRVNFRDGPGRRHGALGVITVGQEAELLEERNEWGKFRLIGGPLDGVEGWVFLPLTDEL